MSDEENFLEQGESGDQEVGVGQKPNIFSGLLLKVLKWVALALGAIIFIVTIVIVTVSIIGGPKSASYSAETPGLTGAKPLYTYYTNIEEIRARTNDDVPATVMVKVVLAYDPQNKKIQNELITRTHELRDLIRKYFSLKSKFDLTPDKEESIKLEIREQIRSVMEQKIKEVIFPDFNVMDF